MQCQIDAKMIEGLMAGIMAGDLSETEEHIR